jgi:hypothetical protein
VKRHGAPGRNTARSRRPISRGDGSRAERRQSDPLREPLRRSQWGELRHLIRARDKASAATRPKQLGVPNVVTIGEDDFHDRLHHVKARPVVFCGCRWIKACTQANMIRLRHPLTRLRRPDWCSPPCSRHRSWRAHLSMRLPRQHSTRAPAPRSTRRSTRDRDVGNARGHGWLVDSGLGKLGDVTRSCRSGDRPTDDTGPASPIGSITKTFTVMIALQLVGESRLSLRDIIDQWYPRITDASLTQG